MFAAMRVFISWSGEPSKRVAVALRDWLPKVIQRLEPWVSEVDIGAGKRWGKEVADALDATEFGILCVIPTNSEAPWLTFEAGTMASQWEEARVCPYLLGMGAAQLPPGPLTQFQASIADRDGTFGLVRSLNGALSEGTLKDGTLEAAFEAFWPKLEEVLEGIDLGEGADTEERSTEDMLAEIVERTRYLTHRMSELHDAERERVIAERVDAMYRLDPLGRAFWRARRRGSKQPSLFDPLPGESVGASAEPEVAAGVAEDDAQAE
jgi:hypothetical protein